MSPPELTPWQQQKSSNPQSEEAAADLLFFHRKNCWNFVPFRSNNICNVLKHDLRAVIIVKLCVILHKTRINGFC